MKPPKRNTTSPSKTRRPRRAEPRGAVKAPIKPSEPTKPVKKDDPSRDKTEMEGSVLQPLPHAD